MQRPAQRAQRAAAPRRRRRRVRNRARRPAARGPGLRPLRRGGGDQRRRRRPPGPVLHQLGGRPGGAQERDRAERGAARHGRAQCRRPDGGAHGRRLPRQRHLLRARSRPAGHGHAPRAGQARGVRRRRRHRRRRGRCRSAHRAGGDPADAQRHHRLPGRECDVVDRGGVGAGHRLVGDPPRAGHLRQRCADRARTLQCVRLPRRHADRRLRPQPGCDPGAVQRDRVHPGQAAGGGDQRRGRPARRRHPPPDPDPGRRVRRGRAVPGPVPARARRRRGAGAAARRPAGRATHQPGRGNPRRVPGHRYRAVAPAAGRPVPDPGGPGGRGAGAYRRAHRAGLNDLPNNARSKLPSPACGRGVGGEGRRTQASRRITSWKLLPSPPPLSHKWERGANT
ncbi:hypothetical protein CBM2586_A11061 [Cupriavidus phytorum]|uniref:Uncharacterized protein n=1 Tax=Cupriavidus taiwanensis TaxID=164546 RepID=A0A375BCG1_9BURK|nr:hypothetical protein CBM2586_A11061 [Cupriavidus taiwanensis]